MKSYSLLTDDSDYEENVDYDKYIKQIDALFESKVYKEFRKYELRGELINFYIESSKYVCENIMHIQNDSLLLYLTEEESKTKDNAFIKWIKDAGAWLKNAWKAIWEAVQRIFSKDARDKAASLETKAKQYDELKTLHENTQSREDEFKREIDAYKSQIDELTTQNEDLRSQSNASAAKYEKRNGDLKKQNKDLKKQNTQQNIKQLMGAASDAYNWASNMFAPKQGAQNDTPAAKLKPNATPQSDGSTPSAPSQPTQNQDQPQQQAASEPQGEVQNYSLDMITRCYNWLRKIYNRVNIDENINGSENSSKNSNPVLERAIDSYKSKIVRSVDLFLNRSKSAQVLYADSDSNKIINPIFSFLASDASKPFSQNLDLHPVTPASVKIELLWAKGLVVDAARDMDYVAKLITKELKATGYNQIYNVIYKILIKYTLIVSLILIVIYFGAAFLYSTASKLFKMDEDEEFISGLINHINYYYSKLAVDSNYIYNFSEIIKLSSNYVDTAQVQFSKILIACSAKACETLLSSSTDEKELEKVFGRSGCIATIKNFMSDIGFNPNWRLNKALSRKIDESIGASVENDVVNIDNLQKIYTDNTNVINQLWNKTSMTIEQGAKVNFYDRLVSDINEAKNSFKKFGQAMIDNTKNMVNKSGEAINGILTAMNNRMGENHEYEF